MKNITIIGAGIGGLTLAIALEQQGFSVSIYEQTPVIQPVGAGIIMANNAMQIYKKLGLATQITEKGNSISRINITDDNLKPLSRIDLSDFEAKYSLKNTAIHRAELQKILLNALTNTEIHLAHTLTDIVYHDNDTDSVELTFTDNSTTESKTKKITAEVVIGADGINSVVRNKILPNNSIRNAGQVCWRGVTEYRLAEKYQHELNEVWGKNARFGFVQIAENSLSQNSSSENSSSENNASTHDTSQNMVYWYALKSFKNHASEFTLDELPTYFADAHQLITELINSTDRQAIHTAEMTDLEPTDTWFIGNVCLIGDAIHATTPNMGQGACQAIESAYTLAQTLSQKASSHYPEKYDLQTAFTRYQQLRQAKAHNITKTSWSIGKISHWHNPLAIQLRNLVVKGTPDAINKQQLADVFMVDL